MLLSPTGQGEINLIEFKHKSLGHKEFPAFLHSPQPTSPPAFKQQQQQPCSKRKSPVSVTSNQNNNNNNKIKNGKAW